MAKNDGLAPENRNREQHDEDAQAQTVADEAIERATAPLGADSTRKEGGSALSEENAEDVVDKMESEKGPIDMEAYRGEPNHDDYVEKYGKPRRPGDTPVNADS